jgi:hypothetical protein
MKTQLNYSSLVRLLLLSLVVFTASSEVEGQTSTYSDLYFDDSDAENGHGYVVGVGVTEDTYNSYSHEYLMTSTLSANDSTSNVGYGQATGTYAYGMAETAIEWTDVTAGSFILTTEHKIVCPYWNMEYWESYTYAEKYVADDGFEEIYYEVELPKLSTRTCAYEICPYQENKFCFRRAGFSEEAKANNPNDADGCYKFVHKGYFIARDPWIGIPFCIRSYKLPTDNTPPGFCDY